MFSGLELVIRMCSLHPGVELTADLKSIYHRCRHLFEEAFVWKLTFLKPSIGPWVASKAGPVA